MAETSSQAVRARPAKTGRERTRGGITLMVRFVRSAVMDRRAGVAASTTTGRLDWQSALLDTAGGLVAE
jgi:hypothetical protein